MRKLKVFISVCMLSTTLPSSVLAGYTLDRDNNGVDIQDVVRALQDSQAAVAITGKSTFDKNDVQNLLSQIQPLSQRSVKGTITGYVLDETGKTVTGAEVVLVDSDLTVQTDASGKFEFNNVPAMYQAKVRVHKADYTDVYSGVFNILPGNSLVLDNLVVTNTPALGSVAGYVFTADQQPLESALVTLNGPAGTRSSYSDMRGYFYLDAVPIGNWNVTVTKDTYVEDALSLIVTANSLVTVPSVYLHKAVNPLPTGSIVGIVKSDTDQPLQGAQVSVTGATYQAFTDATGTFMLTQIPYGAVDLDIAMAGYQSAHISGVPVTADVYNTGMTRLISQGADSTPPQLSDVTTGVAELDSQQVKATSNESAILYLVPSETTSNAGDIAAHYVAKTNAANGEVASIELLNVPQGDYVLYAIDAAGNISNPSDKINVRKSVANALLTIRNGLHTANMDGVTKYDYERAGLHSLYNEQLDLYGFALNMDREALLSVIDEHAFVDKMQVWVDTANETPVIQRALMSGFFSGLSNFDWSYLNADAESILAGYHLSGIYSTSQLIAAERLMEQAYTQGNYKLLSKETIQTAIDHSVPTEYAAQIVSQHLKADGSNVVVTFKLASSSGEGVTGLTASDVKAKVGGETRGIFDPSMFTNFTDLGEGLYSFEVLESVLASPILLDNLTAQVYGADITIAAAVSVNRQAALIEQAVAGHNQSILSGALLLTGNLINSLADIDLFDLLSLNQNLELAYAAHGNELTEASIRRIINGMKLLADQSQSLDDVVDTYGLTFKQNVTGDVRSSVTMRTSSGYLSKYGASGSGNRYEFSFEHTSEYPVVLTYIATDAEKLTYTSDGSVVPDFEIIFTFPLV